MASATIVKQVVRASQNRPTTNSPNTRELSDAKIVEISGVSG
jgi:hypothetical protein